ncbi:MAG: amidohydrolase [Deltaproteobacteria bacterium]|nr:amidohydrolase [Deltaproteobacteria bacterium]
MNHQHLSDLIRERLPGLTAVRQALHRQPELAHREFETAARVREQLAGLGLRVFDPFLKTDVVALLEGNSAGPNVTLRADMDALSVAEKSDLPYRSQVPGVSHACGHDGHTAMLIGAAQVLSRLRDSFRGTVRFVFQPGEEIVAGARDLIAQGILDDPAPDAILALHGWPGIAPGVVASRPGAMMAASDMFRITVKGKGAHGSMPEKSIDPILTGARIVEALQCIPGHRIAAVEPVVVSVGRFQGGSEVNVIPETATVEGTVRYLEREIGGQVARHLENLVKGTCLAMGAEFDLEYVRDYPPTHNDAALVGAAKKLVTELFGAEGWFDIAKPSMGSEDFSYFLRWGPGAMFRLGMGENSPLLHSPYYNFNDAALERGIHFLVAMTLEKLAPDRNRRD